MDSCKKTYELKRMKNLRLSRGWTQKEVSEMFCVTRECYANYESGRREMGYSQLIRAAELFGVSVDYLLGRQYSRMEPHQPKELDEVALWEHLRSGKENYLNLQGLPENSRSALRTIFWELKFGSHRLDCDK